MILLDYKDSRPIYEQVAEKLQELMILGILEEDSQMPSVRSLATELSINPNTIQRAYGELERNGFIYSVKGRGSFVGNIRRLRESRRADLVKRLQGLAKEAKSLDMSREDFVRASADAYDSVCSEAAYDSIGNEAAYDGFGSTEANGSQEYEKGGKA